MGRTSLHLPALHAPAQCAADLVAYRLSGPRIAVVAKIAFALAPGLVERLAPRPELLERDQHRDRAPARSLEAAHDLAPILPGAEVLVVGHAHAPDGLAVAALDVSVKLQRDDGAVLDKRVRVVGDRSHPGAAPRPFHRMPLAWERALRTDKNPVGVDGAMDLGNVFDPARPSLAAGFGPLSPAWRVRRDRLGVVSLKTFEQEPYELPPSFDFGFFFAAPEDQRLPSLRGDEWLILEGLHPHARRLQLRLPAARLDARLVEEDGAIVRALHMMADRLVVHTDRREATLTYRGGFAFESAAPTRQRVEIGIVLGEGAPEFPDWRDPSTRRGRPRTRDAAAHLVLPSSANPATIVARDDTSQVDMTRMISAVLPFAGAAARPANDARPQIGGLPFGDVLPSAPRVPPGGLPDTAELPLGAMMRTVLVDAGKAEPVSATPSELAREAPPPARVGAFAQMTAPPDEEAARVAALPFDELVALSRPRRTGVFEGLPFVDLRDGGATDGASATRGPSQRDAARKGRSLERLTDRVPTVTDGPLAMTASCWQIVPPDDVLVVIVKASFSLVPNAAARIMDEPELLLGDAYVDDDTARALARASDLAVLKRRVDVIVRGAAYAPNTRTTMMQAALRLKGASGAIDRSVAVLGDRTWSGVLQRSPTAPQVFQRVPMRFDHAYGGAGFAANPNGRGHKTASGGGAALPNLEEIGALIGSPNDTPEPACLGPIHPQASARWGCIGSYDRAWQKTRWPSFAEDFDYAYFQAASPKQQLDRIDGGESYELVGLHREHPVLRGTLPTSKVRAFVERSDGGWSEIALRVDTVTFAPDDDAVHLVWRGFLGVSDDDAPEIANLFATLDDEAHPLSLDDARARFLAVVEPRATPEPVATPRWGASTTEVAPDEDAADAARRRQVEEQIAAVETASPSPHAPVDGDAPLPKPDPEAIAASMRAGGASEEEVAMLAAALRPHPTEPPPPLDVDPRALVQGRIERGEALAGLDLAGADLRDLDLVGQDLSGANLTAARLDRAKLDGANLASARLPRATLAHATLAAADLRGADLAGADLSDASLPNALCDRVDAEGARAPRSDWTGARLVRAKLERADLLGANLDRADLTDAAMSGARLDGANLREAKLVRTRLYDASGARAVLDHADLSGARAEAAEFAFASFRFVVAEESIWERARLEGASFAGAALRGSSFQRARCRKAVFSGADLRGARLSRCDLAASELVRANLMESSLDRANLALADLRESNLYGASLRRARLDDAQRGGANLTRSDLDARLR